MTSQFCVAAILFCLFSVVLSSGCDVGNVAVYKMRLRMLWSEERFPKDYPKFWPKAQWSPVFGQSHNSNYSLYRMGELARESILKYSQFGKLDTLIGEGDEEPMVYDQFSAQAIKTGEGETENMVFVDGGHSLVSLICRMVPSPDWFIGVDSLNLCVDSTWIEQITLDLEPLDAGAASGLAFTAPRWESKPPEVVKRHGPKSPNHPAAGFYYPELKELPSIARVEFTRIKEYSTKEINNLTRKELMKKRKSKLSRKESQFKRKYDAAPTKIYKLASFNIENGKDLIDAVEPTTINNFDQLKNLEEDPVGTPVLNDPNNNVEVVTKAPKTTTTTTSEPEFGAELHSMDDVMLAVAHGRKLGLGKHLPRHFRSRLHHAVNKLTPNDCLVSDWGEWTTCSATCGFGDKFRTRQVLRKPTSEGRECPDLTERTHCGNANSCFDMEYFYW